VYDVEKNELVADVDSLAFDTSNVSRVACVGTNRDTSAKLKECPIVDENQVTVDVDFMSQNFVVQELDVVSGEEIGEKATLPADDLECPTLADISGENPKLYASLTETALSGSLAAN